MEFWGDGNSLVAYRILCYSFVGGGTVTCGDLNTLGGSCILLLGPVFVGGGCCITTLRSGMLCTGGACA
eukprot:12418082-Ditylum_brightwellii.AAC.1